MQDDSGRHGEEPELQQLAAAAPPEEMTNEGEPENVHVKVGQGNGTVGFAGWTAASRKALSILRPSGSSPDATSTQSPAMEN